MWGTCDKPETLARMTMRVMLVDAWSWSFAYHNQARRTATFWEKTGTYNFMWVPVFGFAASLSRVGALSSQSSTLGIL
jgi:hypothetical protein